MLKKTWISSLYVLLFNRPELFQQLVIDKPVTDPESFFHDFCDGEIVAGA